MNTQFFTVKYFTAIKLESSNRWGAILWRFHKNSKFLHASKKDCFPQVSEVPTDTLQRESRISKYPWEKSYDKFSLNGSRTDQIIQSWTDFKG